jgi:hypothetical protein
MTELQFDGNRALPFSRDELGRFVREAWVRWAQRQPAPKPSWLVPYDELSEADKEADRQIGETVARWTLIGDAARFAMIEDSPHLSRLRRETLAPPLVLKEVGNGWSLGMLMPEHDVREARWHNGMESRFMTERDGWVMVRRPGCIPYTVFKKEWLKLPLAEMGRQLAEAYKLAPQPLTASSPSTVEPGTVDAREEP